jgi:NADH-quinone oxidoreductase subunit L
MADRLVERLRGVYALLVNKYWIDQVYNALIVTPLLFFSRYLLWGAVDRGVINGGAGIAAGGVRGLGALVQRVQSGNIRSYAGWLAIGAGALLLITYFGFSMHL